MTPLDIAFLALVPAVLTAMHLTTKRARTAPGMFALACTASFAACAALVLHGIGRDFTPWMTMMMTAVVLSLVTAGWIAVVTGSGHTPAGYVEQGDDDRAIHDACRAHDEARTAIEAFAGDRGRMGWLDRLRDSFVTTDDEERIAGQHGRRAAALLHITRIVGPWYARRVDALIDGDGARGDMTALEEALEPLTKSEDTARHVHGLSIAAMDALNGAISELDSAQTYETLDALSSNKGVAMVSSMQNSSASDAVNRANVAMARLSEASRQAIDCNLTVPGDTFDLILDMGLDGAFDFMSFYNLSRLSDAESRCRAAWDRVASVEPRLRTALETAIADATPARERLAERLRPYREAALAELPNTARQHIIAQGGIQ